MLKKITRDICLIKYRTFPLSAFDDKVDKDYHYFPANFSFYWLKSNENTKKNIIKECLNLFEKLNIEKLIFFGEFNKPWISKFTASRTDYKQLTKALDYFKSSKIGKNFNGGVKVEKKYFSEFLRHFYILTRCDSGFFDFNFTDEKEDFMFYLHYSGELRVFCLNEKSNTIFLKSVVDTNFIDANFNYKCDKIY